MLVPNVEPCMAKTDFDLETLSRVDHNIGSERVLHNRPTSFALAIEPEAWYRVSQIYSTPTRRGIVPVGKTWLFEQIAIGRLKTRKIGKRATVVAGSDILEFLGKSVVDGAQ